MQSICQQIDILLTFFHTLMFFCHPNLGCQNRFDTTTCHLRKNFTLRGYSVAQRGATLGAGAVLALSSLDLRSFFTNFGSAPVSKAWRWRCSKPSFWRYATLYSDGHYCFESKSKRLQILPQVPQVQRIRIKATPNAFGQKCVGGGGP